MHIIENISTFISVMKPLLFVSMWRKSFFLVPVCVCVTGSFIWSTRKTNLHFIISSISRAKPPVSEATAYTNILVCCCMLFLMYNPCEPSNNTACGVRVWMCVRVCVCVRARVRMHMSVRLSSWYIYTGYLMPRPLSLSPFFCRWSGGKITTGG